MRMKAFWNDCGNELASDHAREVDLHEASLIWSDGRGVQSNFLGLIDEQGRTVQFYFESSIPDDVDDARHLQIVLMDFSQVKQKGSYRRRVAIGEVHQLIERAFRAGADPLHFGELTFTAW